MMTHPRLPMLLFTLPTVAVLLVLTPLAAAKGMFSKVVVYGQGVVIESDDPSLLDFDSFNSFSDPVPGIPSVTGEGFLIVRMGQDQQTGEYIVFDSLRFFPSSLGPGSKPFVYYEGLVNGWSEYDRKWYAAKPGAMEAIQRQSTSQAERSSSPAIGSSIALALSGLAGIAIGVLGLALVRHR